MRTSIQVNITVKINVAATVYALVALLALFM